MFKNPLKYQQGGAVSSEEQAENELVSVIAQALGTEEQPVRERLNQIKQNKKETEQLQEALKMMQTDKNQGFKALLTLFTTQQQQPAYKQGGKILDFICKHARGGAVAGCECVEKAQGGKTMPYTRGSYQPSDYFNSAGTWIETPNGMAQNYRPYFIGGRNWGFGGNDLEQVLVVPGVTGIPRRAIRRISNWFNPDVPTEKLDTTYQDANGNSKNSAEFEARVNRELEGVSGQRPFQKENGGKVEKAQDGNILDFYKNKWSNDLSRIKFGWNKFKESAPGKVLSAFMPNPNSETGMLGAAAPIGKIKVIPEGKIGSLRRANYDPFVWEVVAKDPVVIENAKNLGLKEGSKEWAEFIEKTARDMDNLAKGMDFLSFKKGGIIQKNQNGSSSLGDFYRNKWKNDFFD